jgi:hypothetical protein
LYLYAGLTNSCHRVNYDLLTIDNIENFHNTPKKINDRKIMLDGQWPAGGCEYCQKIENAGGVSDRIMQLKVPDLTPPEVIDDHTAVEVTPRIVEVYFDNTCNMSCVYCSDMHSSRIQQENTKFGRFEKSGVIIDNMFSKQHDFAQLTQKFWSWLDKNYQTIHRFHIVGGEPFYQKQLDNYIDFLSARKNTKLELNIISNLMIDHARLTDKIGKLKKLVVERKIKRFELTASIDCWGTQQEYIRQGLDLSLWKQNFEYIVNEPWIVLNINQVISALSVPSMVPLLEYVNSLRSKRTIGHHLITVALPTYMNPDIFGGGVFDQEFEAILSVMPEDTWQQKEVKDYMQGVMLQISKNQPNPQELAKLKIYLTELDRRRGTDWQETFPWLVKELQDVV